MGDGMRQAIVLVGHGGVPKDYPHDLVITLKRLEAQRRGTGGDLSEEERELDRRIRHWPRTPRTDPYKYGLESLAAHLKGMLDGTLFALAYNEFCAPTLEEAVDEVIAAGARGITVVSSMFTPGGSHAEIEIPETLAQLRTRHPDIVLRYAWPFDLNLVATMLVQHINEYREA